MSNDTTALAPKDLEAANAISEALSAGRQELSAATDAMRRTLAMAAVIQKLRDLIPVEYIQQHFMPLQNTSLGFRTDKPTGYTPEVVRDVMIEAMIQGARPVGNEINIISGRAYFTKECFTRLVREFPGVGDLQLLPGVPQTSSGGALVPYIATWTLNGTPMRLERIQTEQIDGRIPVRVNAGMGADAILGKATRKMLKAIHDQLEGASAGLPDGDIDDVPTPGRGMERERAVMTVEELRPGKSANRGHGDTGLGDVTPKTTMFDDSNGK